VADDLDAGLAPGRRAGHRQPQILDGRDLLAVELHDDVLGFIPARAAGPVSEGLSSCPLSPVIRTPFPCLTPKNRAMAGVHGIP